MRNHGHHLAGMNLGQPLQGIDGPPLCLAHGLAAGEVRAGRHGLDHRPHLAVDQLIDLPTLPCAEVDFAHRVQRLDAPDQVMSRDRA